MKITPAVCCVIVNYRTSGMLPHALNSLRCQDVPVDVKVVDNSVSDDEKKRLIALRKQFDFDLIINNENVGFGSACNQAIRETDADYILCMNTDIILLPGAVGTLIKGLKETGAALAGPRFYWDREKNFMLPPSISESWLTESILLWAGRMESVSSWWSTYWEKKELQFWNVTNPLIQRQISGACIMAARQALDESGRLFDPSYFLYYEDTELCRRLRREKKDVYLVPRSRAVHLYSQSPASSEFKDSAMRKSRAIYRNGYGFWQKVLIALQKRLVRMIPEKPYPVSDTIIDLGKTETPPCFSWKWNGSCRLRIGINPLFVPSACAWIDNSSFSLPKDLWNQMHPGIYFIEAKRQDSGKCLGLWKIEKLPGKNQ